MDLRNTTSSFQIFAKSLGWICTYSHFDYLVKMTYASNQRNVKHLDELQATFAAELGLNLAT